MKRMILSGCFGRMGRAVTAMVAHSDSLKLVAGVDVLPETADFPVYDSVSKVAEQADVLVDFSHSSALPDLLKFGLTTGTALVLCTTGYSEEDVASIHEAAKQIPIFFSFNMSLGVNLLVSLAGQAARLLGSDFDVEIIEKHHNQKLDAPSGTALMIAKAVDESRGGGMQFEYDRHSRRQQRDSREIGIHSVRGGTIVGEHQVLFAGKDEVITLTHEATSREIFATGAVKAAAFMCEKQPGLYDMSSMIGS